MVKFSISMMVTGRDHHTALAFHSSLGYGHPLVKAQTIIKGSNRQTSKLKEQLELDQMGLSRIPDRSATANRYCNGTTVGLFAPRGPFELQLFLDPRRRPVFCLFEPFTARVAHNYPRPSWGVQ